MTTETLDERQGLPSASSALENSLCAGRWQAQKAFTDAICEVEEQDESDEDDEHEIKTKGTTPDMDKDAEAGKRIHSLYAKQPCPGASQAEIDRAEAAHKVDAKMYEIWQTLFRGLPEQPVIELREVRWWLRDEGGAPLYSGQSDAVWIRGEMGGPADILLADLKGLWGYHDPAKLNCQIRHYIALIANSITEYGYTHVVSALAYLNQPAKTMSPQPVEFDLEAIQKAIELMKEEVEMISSEDALRTPGPVQCRRCIAKLTCEEYHQEQAIITAPLSFTAESTKEQLTEKIGMLLPNKLAILCDWAPALKDAAKLAENEAKRRLREDAASVPGYRLKENSPREKVVDVKLVFTRLAQKGVTADEFATLCSISKSNIEIALRSKTGTKGKALDDAVSATVKGATMPIKVSASLEKING